MPEIPAIPEQGDIARLASTIKTREDTTFEVATDRAPEVTKIQQILTAINRNDICNP